MLPFKKPIHVFAAALCAGLTLPAQAALVVNVCHGEVHVLSQRQTDKGIDLEVEVSIRDCTGECIGSLEYDLLFTAADNHETLWHLTENWNWRSLEGPFTLQIHQQALPNAQLQEVKAMKIGRCSCSTASAD